VNTQPDQAFPLICIDRPGLSDSSWAQMSIIIIIIIIMDDHGSYISANVDLIRLTWRTLVGNHVNVMLVFVPVGKTTSNSKFAGRFDFATKRFVRRVILSYVHEL
jgi:hypothetical protein